MVCNRSPPLTGLSFLRCNGIMHSQFIQVFCLTLAFFERWDCAHQTAQGIQTIQTTPAPQEEPVLFARVYSKQAPYAACARGSVL